MSNKEEANLENVTDYVEDVSLDSKATQEAMTGFQSEVETESKENKSTHNWTRSDVTYISDQLLLSQEEVEYVLLNQHTDIHNVKDMIKAMLYD